MAAPCIGDRAKALRIAKYLNRECRRVVYMSPFGGDDVVIHAHSDSDWAGCLKTPRSTSGGVLLIGQCTINHRPPTQKALALSSAEAELYVATRDLRGQGVEVFRTRIRRRASGSSCGSARRRRYG